jgi:hypothetical protein
VLKTKFPGLAIPNNDEIDIDLDSDEKEKTS